MPEKRTERTTEGGLDVVGGHDRLVPFVAELSRAGIRVSLFIEPRLDSLTPRASIGAPVVELHTGAWCDAVTQGETDKAEREFDSACARRRRMAERSGSNAMPAMGSTSTRRGPIAALPQIAELNIGHFLIGEAIFIGLDAAVRRMMRARWTGPAQRG